jgi:hypothetical protein
MQPQYNWVLIDPEAIAQGWITAFNAPVLDLLADGECCSVLNLLK